MPALNILMVCMGNICRSPTAEAVLRSRAAQRVELAPLFIDSAGTHGYHHGEPPDLRSIRAAAKRGYDLSAQRSRPLLLDDFARFDFILGMDQHNLHIIEAKRPQEFTGHIGLLLDYAPQQSQREVPDPYHGGNHGFDDVLDLIEMSATVCSIICLPPITRSENCRHAQNPKLRLCKREHSAFKATVFPYDRTSSLNILD